MFSSLKALLGLNRNTVSSKEVKLSPLTSRITVYTLPQWIFAFIKFGVGGGLCAMCLFLGIPIPAGMLMGNPINTHIPSTGYVVVKAGIQLRPKYPDNSNARRRLNSRASLGRDDSTFLDTTQGVKALNRFWPYPRPKIVTDYPKSRNPLDSILTRKNLTGKKVIFSNGLEDLYAAGSPVLNVPGELYPNRVVGKVYRFPFRGSKPAPRAQAMCLHTYNNYYKWICKAILDGYDSWIESYLSTGESGEITQPMCKLTLTPDELDQSLLNLTHKSVFNAIWEDTSRILADLERLENPRLTDVHMFTHYESVLRVFGNLQSLLTLQGEIPAEKVLAMIKIVEVYQLLLELLTTKIINPSDVLTLQAFLAHAKLCKDRLQDAYLACPNRADGLFTIRQFTNSRGYLVYVDLIPRGIAPSIDKLSSLAEDEN